MQVTVRKIGKNYYTAEIDTLPDVLEYGETVQEVSELALSTILVTAETLGHQMPGYQDLVRKEIYFDVEDAD